MAKTKVEPIVTLAMIADAREKKERAKRCGDEEDQFYAEDEFYSICDSHKPALLKGKKLWVNCNRYSGEIEIYTSRKGGKPICTAKGSSLFEGNTESNWRFWASLADLDDVTTTPESDAMWDERMAAGICAND
jgi:hypothetical protein